MKVLIVDDEKSIRITLSAFLVNEGYDVDVAEDFESALAILGQKEIDVVISDIVMPRVSGVTLLKRIKETAPNVKVIMMTGEPTLETAVEAVRAGASDYLTKPVGKPAILHSVANAARFRALEDEKRLLEAQNLEYQNNLAELVDQRTQELQKALTTLQKAQKQLIQQERMSALGQMASGIAHDFNNVLMPITGFSEILLEDPHALDDREEALHMLRMIKTCGDDARHIVRRLRLIYKEEESDYTMMDLAEVLESVVSLTMPKWKEEMNAKGVNIEIETEFEEHSPIKGNISELREALTNLIFNAVDALPEGGTITLRLLAQGKGGVVLEVSDNGIGMDSETLSRCMEPFFTSKGEQGSGLGLSMVHGVVQRHGGSMDVNSESGVGTTVRMCFPVPADTRVAEEDSTKMAEALSPMRLLVVDDEARSRHIMSRILKRDGHSVELAERGEEGIKKALSGSYDMIITDRAMPFMSGDEVAATIARTKPNLPIIMVTGFGDIMNGEGECPVGVRQVLTKPVTVNDLRNVMTLVMNAEKNQ